MASRFKCPGCSGEKAVPNAREVSDRCTPVAPSRPPLQWTEDQIDEVLSDSFPASDPPPWTLGVARAGIQQRQDGEDDGVLHRPGRERPSAAPSISPGMARGGEPAVEIEGGADQRQV